MPNSSATNRDERQNAAEVLTPALALRWLADKGLRRSKSTFYGDLNANRIKHTRLGKHIYIPISELERLVTGNGAS